MFDFSNDQDAQSYDLIKEGSYSMIIQEVEEKTTKAFDKMLTFRFVVTEGDFKGRIVFENFLLTGNEKAVTIARSKLKSILKLSDRGLSISGPHEFVGIELACYIKTKKDDTYGDKNIISSYKQATKNNEYLPF